MAGDITVKGPCFAQHYALGKWVEYPTVGRRDPNGKLSFSSFAYITKPIACGVQYATEDWSPRDFETYWTLESEVDLVAYGGFKYRFNKTAWVPFFWARDFDDVIALAEYVRSGTTVQIVNADTGETIPLHVL